MEKILIFTNYFSLGSVESSLGELKNIPLVENNNTIVFNEKTQEFQVATSINIGSIFFIKDNITEQSLNGFIGEYDKSKIGVLKHRQPQIDFSDYGKCEPTGTHEANGRFYPDVLRIITGNDNDKFSKLQRAIWNTDNAQQQKEQAVKELLEDKIYQGNIPDTLPNELSEFQAVYTTFKSAVDALSEEEKKLTNNKFACLIKQLKKDLGV